MSKTNCINCGAGIELNTNICPFCGTPYLNIDENIIRFNHPFIIRIIVPGLKEPLQMKAYVHDAKFIESPGTVFRDESGRIKKTFSTVTTLDMNIIATEERVIKGD